MRPEAQVSPDPQHNGSDARRLPPGCSTDCSESRNNAKNHHGSCGMDGKAGAHLQLAAVKLQQAPVREEQLAPHSGSSQQRRAPQVLLLHLEGAAASLQNAALVRMGAPAGDGRRTSLHP